MDGDRAYLSKVDFPAPRKPQMIVRGTRFESTDGLSSEVSRSALLVPCFEWADTVDHAARCPRDVVVVGGRGNSLQMRLGHGGRDRKGDRPSHDALNSALPAPSLPLPPMSLTTPPAAPFAAVPTGARSPAHVLDIINGPGDVEWKCVCPPCSCTPSTPEGCCD